MVASVPDCENIIRFTADVLEAYTAAVIHYNCSRGEMSCIGWHSLSKYFNPHYAIPFEKSGLLSQIITVKQMTHCDKLQNTPIHSVMPFYSDKEDHIKAFCMLPIEKWNGILYVDTKQKWNFTRKELIWMQHAVGLISDALSAVEAKIQRDDYTEILTFFYGVDNLLEAHDKADEVPIREIIDRTTRFLRADHGFLASRRSLAKGIKLEAVTSNTEQLIKRRRFDFSGSLIEYTFEKQKSVFLSRTSIHGREHYILYPGEPFGHGGCFYGYYGSTHEAEWVLAFLAEAESNIGSDHIYGAQRTFKTLLNTIERYYLRKEYELKTLYDTNTGFLHARAFQLVFQQQFQHAVGHNKELVLILLQWEPYLSLCTITTPELLSEWANQIASALKENLLLPNAKAGILGENRIGIILSRDDEKHATNYITFARQCEHFLTGLELGKRLNYSLRFYTGTAVYPHDASHIPELWNKAYASLIERMKIVNGDHDADDRSEEDALDVLASIRRT